MRMTREELREWFTDWMDDYYDFLEDDLTPEVAESVLVALSTPTLTPPNEWVSVEERLPGGSGDYICVLQDKNGCEWVIPAEWSREMKTWFGRFGEIRNKVIHWMELPAQPDRRQPEGEANA